MMAVILAGGKGTRLKPFTMTIPKPLLPLGDVPILEVVLKQLAAAGFKRVVMTLGHMAPLFQAQLGDGSRFGMEITYVIEDEPLGTAGPLRLIPELEEDFLIMNGDLLTTLDYRALMEFHCRNQALGTISLQSREVRIDYGVVHTSEEGCLSDYVEKPSIPYEVSMGINVLSRRCREFIPATGKFDMPQLMLAMHHAGHRVMCYRPDCYWKDIGRFDDYQEASADFDANPERFLLPDRRPAIPGQP
jgi:NDP-sugar pyrophosphorylase family protein